MEAGARLEWEKTRQKGKYISAFIIAQNRWHVFMRGESFNVLPQAFPERHSLKAKLRQDCVKSERSIC